MKLLEVNKVFIPLVNRFLQLDNYEKMHAVLDIGMAGLDVVEKYYKASSELNGISKEIEMYKRNIGELEERLYEVNKEKHGLSEKLHEDMMNLRKELERKHADELLDKSQYLGLSDSLCLRRFTLLFF